MPNPDSICFETRIAFEQGDITAYARIYKSYFPRLYNYGKKFTDDIDQIQDCIQDIFTHFWLNRERLGHVKSLQAYLFSSFRNNLLKLLAQSRKHELLDDQQSPYSFYFDLSVDHLMINNDQIYEQKINLEQVLKKLTPRQREALFFKFYENMSYEEIGKLLSITTRACYKLVARAIIELRSTYMEKMARITSTCILLITGFASILVV